MFIYNAPSKMSHLILTTSRCSAPSSISACITSVSPSHARFLSHLDLYSLHLGSLHNIALNLQLAAHEQLLRIRLASDQLSKVLVAQHQRDGGLLALWRKALADSARLLQVDEPRLGLP